LLRYPNGAGTVVTVDGFETSNPGTLSKASHDEPSAGQPIELH